MKGLFFAILFTLLSATNLLPQGRSPEGTQSRHIHGEVRFADGRIAGVGLYVALESDASGGFLTTQTDSRGKFSFNGLANVRYRVRVRGAGYEEEVQETDLSIMPVAYLRFTLRPKPVTNTPQPISGVTSSPHFPDDMPDEARKEFQQGLDIFTSGKNQQKSISHFKKSADKYPQYAPTFYYLGTAHAIDKNLDEAESALRKSIELNDKSPEALIALGSVYNAKKQHADAEGLLVKAVELAPESFDAHKELAKALLPDLQRTPDAEQHLRKAVSLNKESVEAHILLGNVFLRERNPQGALNEYQQALRLDPKGPMAEPTRQMVAKLETALKSSK
jgi:cytochrome c-type biogenesis protein CcmH/NrfG